MLEMKAVFTAVRVWLALLFILGAAAGNSGGFRGPERNGIFPAQGLLKKWPEGLPKLLWEAKVGGGWTGASVAEGRVFFAGGDGSNGVMRVFDLDGKELWYTICAPARKRNESGAQNRPSPRS